MTREGKLSLRESKLLYMKSGRLVSYRYLGWRPNPELAQPTDKHNTNGRRPNDNDNNYDDGA